MNSKLRFFAYAFVLLTLLASLASASRVAATPSADPADQQRVIVYFEPARKGAVMNALQAAKGQVHYEFDDVGAIAVTLPTQALQGIQHNPNVTGIEADVLRYPMGEGQTIPYGIDMVQARDVWDANRDGVVDAGAATGAGITVCVIDSGIYAAHEDFAGLNISGGYPATYNNDTCGHGSHVAGTIAAVNNSVGVVGVTPGAVNFYFVQVFSGADCGWTYSSTLADAANRCKAAGAKVISMSLGGSKKNRLEETTFNNLYSQGILSIAAAGNEGTSALSYPASYDSVMSVAAIDANKVVAEFSQFNSQVEIAAPGVAVLSTVPWLATNTLTVDGATYQANHIEYAATNKTVSGALVNGGLCDATGAWSGKVVLCERGVIDFYTKVMNVQNSGGVAAVIYNNVPGNFLGTLGEGNSSTIVAISLSQEDGQYLVANKLGSTGTVASSLVQPASGYEAWDGTSMATPHVSAVAALVWSWNPAKTNAQIRTALTATALDLGAAGRDVYYGYGLVQACSALQYLGGQCGGGAPNVPPTANFAYTANNLIVTFTDQSTDTDGNIVAWSWNFGDGGTSTAQNPVHTYAAAGTYTVGLTVTDDDGATASTSKSVTVSSSGGAIMFVDDIAMSGKKAGTNRYAIAVVTIKDMDTNLVSGATVYGAWSGATTGSVSGVTGSNGTVSFQSASIKKAGTFTFTVTNVTKSGFTYNPALNKETSDSVTVQ
ncbi:MAG TPA: S8 family serine peptidase [Anaerolineae bacterium]|nr:S8 family serine peptidase [Anaerolineae bacterium]HQI82968.1 S8 family serine peptidase [Anaerolineae bacterium]